MADYPGAIFTQADVPPGTNLGGATPTHRVRENNMKDEIVATETELGINPHLLDATVAVTTTPATVKQKTDVLSRRVADIIGTFSGSVAISLGGLAALFDATTGHTHSGSGTNGPKADAGKLQGRNVSAAAPSVGDVPTWSGSAWAPAAGGGGGGGGAGTINIEELDGTPTGAFDTLKVPNGSLTDNMDGSASLAFAGGGLGWGDFGYDTPSVPGNVASQSFTALNAGATTLTDDADQGWLLQSGADYDNDVHGFYVAAPATPWKLTIGMTILCAPWDFAYVSPFFADSGGGPNIENLRIGRASGPTLIVSQWTTPGTFGSNVRGPTPREPSGLLVWVQIADDGTNRKYRLGLGKSRWQEIHSVGRTSFLTATRVGIAACSGSGDVAGTFTLAHIFHWAFS